MANKEHLKILKLGVEVWNEWREANPDVKPDLSNANLININLSANLIGVNLSGADLKGINLSGAHLKIADFSSTDLRDANLSITDFQAASFQSADLRGACLVSADLSTAELRDADLSSTDLSKAVFFMAKLQGANLHSAKLQDTNLHSANLQDANLSGSDLRNANLQGADLSNTNLHSANLQGANLFNANLTDSKVYSTDFSFATLSHTLLANNFLRNSIFRGAYLCHILLTNTKLLNADLSNANLSKAFLDHADLRGANLSGACLMDANLEEANLESANLKSADLRDAKLLGGNLKRAHLSFADLDNADIEGADFTEANLTNASLTQVKAVHTKFENATLTGACVEDWNINVATDLSNVTCNYVYFKWAENREDWSERRPSDPNRNFAPGDFAKLVQKALNTVDLIFAEGIDWKAFFQSFQELQSQYAHQELSIQAIEKKAGRAFVIRLETPFEVDKAAIESAAMEKYQAQLQLLESRYEERLQLKGEQLEIYQQQVIDYRHQNTNLIELAKLAASRPINVEANAVSNSQSGDTYNGTIKATNFAPHGPAIGGIFNDYSQTITNNLDEIGQLITTLRSQAEQFPPDARDEVLEHLNDLQEDLQHPDKVKPSRLKASLSTILVIAVGLGGAIATATDFANNVLELSNKFGVELVQPKSLQSSTLLESPHSQGT